VGVSESGATISAKILPTKPTEAHKFPKRPLRLFTRQNHTIPNDCAGEPPSHQVSKTVPQFIIPAASNELKHRDHKLTVSSLPAIMGISRDSRHKRSASGAKRAYYRSSIP